MKEQSHNSLRLARVTCRGLALSTHGDLFDVHFAYIQGVEQNYELCNSLF